MKKEKDECEIIWSFEILFRKHTRIYGKWFLVYKLKRSLHIWFGKKYEITIKW